MSFVGPAAGNAEDEDEPKNESSGRSGQPVRQGVVGVVAAFGEAAFGKVRKPVPENFGVIRIGVLQVRPPVCKFIVSRSTESATLTFR